MQKKPKKKPVSRHRPPASVFHHDTEPSDVFIVEDERGISQFIRLALQPLGVKAECFRTADEAIAGLDRCRPDIVFLDVALKDSDAIDVIRALADMHFGGVVQLMSGRGGPLLDDVRRIGARYGLTMRPPLEKPFRAEAIREVIRSEPFDDGLAQTTLELAPAKRFGISEALEKGWLELWYQPKIDLRSKALAGVEGLVRCRHPVLGLLDTEGLVHEEDAGAQAALAERMIIAALHDWDELSQAGTPVRVAIGTTISALSRLELPVLVRRHRPKSSKWPGLILELAENEVVKDIDLVHEIATQLSIWGVTLAIDDFGEGFSSFARMRELPFAELKLDAGFVGGCAEDVRNAGICKAIIDLAHHFGVMSVANGLERVQDLTAIRAMGCDLGQGSILAEPMCKADLITTLVARAQARQAWIA